MENSFGEFLRKKRIEKNLTQKELSKLLFVSESAVSKWEKNVARPDITLLPKLSEILDVSEHEIITSSIDNKAREEKAQAKKWRVLSLSWSLFFYIAYTVALIPCFICNLAINKTLSWFWIVLSALVLAFTFTNLPQLIKKHKLIFIPLSEYIALILLFLVCCLYTGGDWFWIPTLSVLLFLIIIFAPIYISKYSVFTKIKKYNEFISVAVDFLMLNILLVVINAYTLINEYADSWWYLKIALPIVCSIYLALNILLSVRFLKTNKLIKTAVVLFLTNIFLYILPLFIKFNKTGSVNIFKADLSSWEVDIMIERNVNLIICLTLLLLAAVFLVVGLFYKNRKNKLK